jgi:hypothetical protein
MQEDVEAIVAVHSRDADFSRFMRREAIRLRRGYYQDDAGDDCSSFETCDDAGSMEVSEDVGGDRLTADQRSLINFG